MKGAKVFTAVLLACGLLFIFIFPHSNQISLVKILKDRGPVWAGQGRLSLPASFVYEGIHTGVESPLGDKVDLGGVQVLGGMVFRVF